MAVWNVGDAPVMTYYVRDAGGDLVDATVTVTLISPAGVVSNPTVGHPATGTYQVNPALTSAGEWEYRFASTGTVQDAAVQRVLVVDPSDVISPSGPPGWAPTLRDVAVHIPTRTRAVGTDNALMGTFTQDTTPTDEQVSVLIDHACAKTVGCTGLPVVPAAYGPATLAAALWAAYWVEIGYPERDADVAVYDRIRTDAVEACAAAGAVNQANGGGSTTDPGAPGDTERQLFYAFPDPPAFADITFL